MKRTLFPISIVLMSSVVLAADISTLATLAIDAPLREIAEKFTRDSGHKVEVRLDTSPNISRRLAAGETPDVLIGLATTVADAVKSGKAIANSRASVGRIGIGVAISRGGRKPDISSSATLKASLLQADAILYSQGASGLYVEQLLRTLGVADQIKAKAVRLATGGDVMKRLGEGRGTEIGFTMVSEIKQGESHGGSLVGALPADLQNYTAFDAVVMSGARNPDAARAFIAALTTPAARQRLAALGWEF